MDGQARARGHVDIIAKDELVLAVGAVLGVVCWDQGFRSIFTSEAGASGRVAWIEDDGRDFVYTRRTDMLVSDLGAMNPSMQH